MTPPRNLVGAMANSRLLRRPWWRRGLFAALLAILVVLTLFPERYRAAVTLTPTDPTSLGLGAALGQLSATNTVFGNQAAVEVSMKIARSVYVREAVTRRMKLVGRLGLGNEVEASRWLERNVKVRTMRGGIVQIETFGTDAAFGRRLVTEYLNATQQRLAQIALRQTAYKRDILLELVSQADDRLTRAQGAYDAFRRQTRFASPGDAINAIGERIPVLQAALRSKEVELNATRQFATDESLDVRQILAQIAALRRQLAEFQSLKPSSDNALGRVVTESTRSQKLERELALANSLYYAYRNFLAGTVVEDLTSTANVRVLEAPFVDTSRQYNLVPAALAILLLLLAAAIEFYGMRPPVGDRPAVA